MRIILFLLSACFASAAPKLSLTWEKNWLEIHGDHLPGSMRVHYLEAYCRANSQTTDWGKHTVVGHETKMVSASDDGSRIELLCNLKDGVIVRHVITARDDEIDSGRLVPGRQGRRCKPVAALRAYYPAVTETWVHAGDDL